VKLDGAPDDPVLAANVCLKDADARVVSRSTTTPAFNYRERVR
jgi:hypothetical protein